MNPIEDVRGYLTGGYGGAWGGGSGEPFLRTRAGRGTSCRPEPRIATATPSKTAIPTPPT